VRKRSTAGVLIKESKPESKGIRGGLPTTVDRGPALLTEGAEHCRRRLELPDQLLARNPGPVLPANVSVGSEGSAARLPAARAVAIHHRPKLAGDLDLDAAAEACGSHDRCRPTDMVFQRHAGLIGTALRHLRASVCQKPSIWRDASACPLQHIGPHAALKHGVQRLGVDPRPRSSRPPPWVWRRARQNPHPHAGGARDPVEQRRRSPRLA